MRWSWLHKPISGQALALLAIAISLLNAGPDMWTALFRPDSMPLPTETRRSQHAEVTKLYDQLIELSSKFSPAIQARNEAELKLLRQTREELREEIDKTIERQEADNGELTKQLARKAIRRGAILIATAMLLVVFVLWSHFGSTKPAGDLPVGETGA